MAGTRRFTVEILGDSRGADEAFGETAVAADASSDAIGDSFDKSTSRVGGFFDKMSGWASGMGLPFSNSLSKVGSKFDEADSKGQKFWTGMSTLGGAALGGVAAGFVAVGVESVRMADEFEPAQARLNAAIKAGGEKVSDYSSAIDLTNQQMAQLGFGMTDSENAMATLTTAMGDGADALNNMGLTADLARYKHTSLAAASELLAKVMGGSNRAVTQLGLNLDIGSGKLTAIRTATESVQKAQLGLKATEEGIADGQIKAAAAATSLTSAHLTLSIAEKNLAEDHQAMGKVFDVLTKKMGGQASAYAATFTGRMAAMKAEVGNLGIKFGEFLIPKLQELMKDVAAAIGWFEKHKDVTKALAITIGVVLGGAIAVFAAQKVGTFLSGVGKMAKGMAGLATTMLEKAGLIEGSEEAVAETSEATGEATTEAFGPIGIALYALGIIAFELYTHWHKIWGDIKAVADDAWHWIDDHLVHPFMSTFDVVERFMHHWGLLVGAAFLLPLAPILGLVYVVVKFHDQIGHLLDDVGKFFENVGKKIVAAFTGAGRWLEHAGEEIIKGLWTGVTKIVQLEKFFYVTIPTKVFDAFAHAALWLVRAGEHVLEGLLHGIEDGIGDIGSVMDKVGHAILHSITSFFGIFSPSKVFHDIGGNLMKGLAEGITTNAPGAQQALLKAVKPLSADISVPSAAGMVAASVAAGGSSGAVGKTGPFTPGQPGAMPGASGGQTVINNINVTSPSNPHQIGSAVAWAMKTPKG